MIFVAYSVFVACAMYGRRFMAATTSDAVIANKKVTSFYLKAVKRFKRKICEQVVQGLGVIYVDPDRMKTNNLILLERASLILHRNLRLDKFQSNRINDFEQEAVFEIYIRCGIISLF